MKFLDPKLRLITAFMLASTLAIGCADRGFKAVDIVAPAEKSGEETAGKEAGAEQAQDKSDEAKDTASIALPQVIALQAEYKETQAEDGEASESTIEQITLTVQADGQDSVDVTLPAFEGWGDAVLFLGAIELGGQTYELSARCDDNKIENRCELVQVFASSVQAEQAEEAVMVAEFILGEDGQYVAMQSTQDEGKSRDFAEDDIISFVDLVIAKDEDRRKEIQANASGFDGDEIFYRKTQELLENIKRTDKSEFILGLKAKKIRDQNGSLELSAKVVTQDGKAAFAVGGLSEVTLADVKSVATVKWTLEEKGNVFDKIRFTAICLDEDCQEIRLLIEDRLGHEAVVADLRINENTNDYELVRSSLKEGLAAISGLIRE